MTDTTTTPPHDENHLIAERREKLAAWRSGGQAFPNDFSRENYAARLDELYSAKTREELEATQNEVKLSMAEQKDKDLVILVTVGAWFSPVTTSDVATLSGFSALFSPSV